MRKRFDEQLAELNSALIKMAESVEAATASAGKALMTQDKILAEKIKASDDEIDQMEKEIEQLCLAIILQQQPVGRDLRLVTAALKMTTDLERIGDHAADISEIVTVMADNPYMKELAQIPLMAEATMKMIGDSINSFVKKDESLAHKVIKRDIEVNDLFEMQKKEMIAFINDSTTEGSQIVELVMIAKYFERIGDHAKNIAEWVIFTLTGMHKESRIL